VCPALFAHFGHGFPDTAPLRLEQPIGRNHAGRDACCNAVKPDGVDHANRKVAKYSAITAKFHALRFCWKNGVRR
jgi:hypothetical protein